MLNKTILSLLLSTVGFAAFAADYYVVIPSKGRAASDPYSGIQVALNTYSLPGAEVGVAYSFSLQPLLSVTGDAAYTGSGVTWSVVSSSLPQGLYLTSAGVIAGTPYASGSGSLTARATYKTKSGEQTYQVVVLNITVGLATGTPPQAVVGQPYSYDLKPLLSVNGDAAYTGSGVTWSVVSNSLPAGLYLTTDGFIGGTPTSGGTGSITARATYRNAKGEQAYHVETLNIQVALGAATPTVAVVGKAYAYDLAPLVTVNGDAQYTPAQLQWALTGSLPEGLALAAGKVTGTAVKAESRQVDIKASYRDVQASRAFTFVSEFSKDIGLFAGYRGWADGTYAASCNGYKNPADGHLYAGSTGDGVYRVKLGSGALLDVYCDMTTAGGGWTLVRRSAPGAWAAVNDNASGTGAAYGTYTPNPKAAAAFSLQYASLFSYSDMLFITGDSVKWVAAPKTSVAAITESCSVLVPVHASHLSSTPYSVGWCQRTSQPEDPWISPSTHNSGGATSIADNDTYSMLYGEQVYAGWGYWRDNRQGANVFVR